MDSEVKVYFRLYIAGQGPNSRLAVSNLANFCETYLVGRYETEIVDVFHHQERALEDRIFITPQLIILTPLPVQTIIGNLSHAEVILQALDLSGMTS